MPDDDADADALSVLLSQLTIAFTIEADNLFEARMPHRTARGPAANSNRGPWLISMAMWSNLLRHLGDERPTPLRDVQPLADLVNLRGLERWGYLRREPNPEGGRSQADDLLVLGRGGIGARKVWAPITGEVEGSWRSRFGDTAVEALRDALRSVSRRIQGDLPWALPVHHRALLAAQLPETLPHPEVGADELPVLLARTLLAFALDVEAQSRLPLPLTANALRVIHPEGIPVKEVSHRAGISVEAADMSLTQLDEQALATQERAGRDRIVRLTEGGIHAQREYYALLERTEESWREQLGAHDVAAIRAAALTILDDRAGMAEGLTPPAAGWRGHPPYAGRAAALLENPRALLPHFPMVLHRGGYPDGS